MNEFVIKNGYISKGDSIVEGGLTATTISATTYQNLPSSPLTVGTTPVTLGTDGRIFFQAGGVVQQDGALLWDNTNKRLGIGTATPTSSIDTTGNITTNSAAGTSTFGTGQIIANSLGNSIGSGFYSQVGTGTGTYGGYGVGYGTTIKWLLGITKNNTDTTSFLFLEDGLAANRRMSIVAGGNVGVGSSVPLAKLQTFSTNQLSQMTLGSTNGVGLTVSNTDNYYGLNFGTAVSGDGWIQQGTTTGGATPYNLSLQASGGRVGIGAISPQARLDVRAQGALSTDVAFRVRNSADTTNIFSVNGNGVFYKPHASSNDDTAQDVFVSEMSDGRNRIRLFTKGSFNVSSAIGISFQSDAAGTNISSYTLAGASILNGQSYKDNGNLSIFNVGTNNVTGYSYLQLRNFNDTATNIYISRTGTIILNPDNVNAQVRGLALFGGTLGTTADRVIAIGNGTAPTTSSADGFQFWSADIVAGNAAPHFRTEAGDVIKLYKETTGVAAATLVGGGGTPITDTDTFDGYTLQQVVKALKNLGVLQ